jgi:hypothetical protein
MPRAILDLYRASGWVGKLVLGEGAYLGERPERARFRSVFNVVIDVHCQWSSRERVLERERLARGPQPRYY